MNTIEPLRDLLQSYFNLRSAVLRRLADEAVDDMTIQDALGLSYEVLRRRRRNASAWQPSEICELATLLNLSNQKVSQLKTFAQQLSKLPTPYRYQLLKACSLNSHKLSLRLSDWQNWKQIELERLALSLGRLPCPAETA